MLIGKQMQQVHLSLNTEHRSYPCVIRLSLTWSGSQYVPRMASWVMTILDPTFPFMSRREENYHHTETEETKEHLHLMDLLSSFPPVKVNYVLNWRINFLSCYIGIFLGGTFLHFFQPVFM